MRQIFFYGTLRDRDLLEVVLGRPVARNALRPARLPGRLAVRAEGQAYPVLADASGETAEGAVFRPEGPGDLARLSFYEEAEYDLVAVTVETADGPVEADCFGATAKLTAGHAPWSLDDWRRDGKTVALEAARELMAFQRTLPVEDVDTVWPGIMMRARQRARGLASPTVAPGGLRSDFGAADVEWERHARPWTDYLTVETHLVRHRLHDGGWSAAASRNTVAWGDAVTILPYDPRADRVLLIEQFRIAAAARLDPAAWLIEVVAGRIDADEAPEETARREAREEAGIEVGRIERMPGCYSTPGLASEYLELFVAEADLAGLEGGVFGREDEGEDIRRLVIGFDEAMAAYAAGEITSAPAQLSLLWLAANRERLRTAWG